MECDQDMENLGHEEGAVGGEIEMEESVTPTNEEVFSPGSKSSAEIPLRIYVSPKKNSETSTSGDTTPDATLLNKSPFEVKLAPKLLRKKQTLPSSPENESSEDDVSKTPEKPDVSKTPEKPERPVNFKNLSPRSVAYTFSSRYPDSGMLRPMKVRRSVNSLCEWKPSDPSTSRSMSGGRSKSADQIEVTYDVCGVPVRKRKHARSASSPDNFGFKGLPRDIASFLHNEIEVEKLSAKMDSTNIKKDAD